MEHFPDGAHVRLRSRVLSTYLRADVDRVGISLSPYRGSLNTAWAVRRVLRDGAAYVVFHGAAYGRYIALCPEDVTRERIIQRACDAPDDDVDILWEVIKPRDGGATNVVLRHGAHHAFLDSPGFPEGDERRRHWQVELIPKPEDSSALGFHTLPASDADAAGAGLVPDFKFFPVQDRAHVRLRIRENNLWFYMFADEDGVSVSKNRHRATLNTVWAVHQVQRHGTVYTLLHSAAYGRYLALPESPEQAQTGQFLQNRYYHDEAQRDIFWQIVREPKEQALGSTVKLRHEMHGMCPQEFDIELVPLRPRPPLLPEPSQKGMSTATSANEIGRKKKFAGCSVYELTDQIAQEIGEEDPRRIILGVWSGYLGRLTPLVIDLPSNEYTIKIVVFVSWTAAGLELPHPNVDAPEPTPGLCEQD